jgi:hypothetical protein
MGDGIMKNRSFIAERQIALGLVRKLSFGIIIIGLLFGCSTTSRDGIWDGRLFETRHFDLGAYQNFENISQDIMIFYSNDEYGLKASLNGVTRITNGISEKGLVLSFHREIFAAEMDQLIRGARSVNMNITAYDLFWSGTIQIKTSQGDNFEMQLGPPSAFILRDGDELLTVVANEELLKRIFDNEGWIIINFNTVTTWHTPGNAIFIENESLEEVKGKIKAFYASFTGQELDW